MTSTTHHHSSSSEEQDCPWILKGFMQIDGPDNRQYIVPEFMFLALEQQCDAYQKKQDLDAYGASGSVSTIHILHSLFMDMYTIFITCQSSILMMPVSYAGYLCWLFMLLTVNARIYMLTILMKVHKFNSDKFDIIGEGLLMAPTILVSTI